MNPADTTEHGIRPATAGTVETPRGWKATGSAEESNQDTSPNGDIGAAVTTGHNRRCPPAGAAPDACEYAQ